MKNNKSRGKAFESYTEQFQLDGAQKVFGASPISGAQNMAKRQQISDQLPQAVSLPPHLYRPSDTQTIDISSLQNVPAGATQILLEIAGRKGSFIKFLGYAIFNDALNLDLIDLVITVNGARVLPLHGNPQQKFKMGLGLGPDLSTLIPVELDLQPNDVLRWTFTNNDVVDIAAGVRMSGYLDQSTIRKTGRFGG